MDCSEEQESRILPDMDFDNAFHPSSLTFNQGLHLDYHAGQRDDYTSQVPEDHIQDSVMSRVEETQFASIEPDIQANQESLRSFIEETQFADLEADTQAADESAVTSFKKPALPNPAVGSSAVPQQHRSPLIKRPDIPGIESAADGFKFARPQAPSQSNYSRRPPRHSTGLLGTNTSNAPETEQPGIQRSEPRSSTAQPNPMAARSPFVSTEKPHHSRSYSNTRTHKGGTIRQAVNIAGDNRLANVAQDNLHKLESSQQNMEYPPGFHLGRVDNGEGSPVHSQVPQPMAKRPVLEPDTLASQQRPCPVTSFPHQILDRRDDLMQQSRMLGPPAPPQNGPLMPLRSAQNAKIVPRTLSRGRQRIKQPFPDATTPTQSRRWRDKTSAGTSTDTIPHIDTGTRPETPSNTGRARLPGDDEKNDDENRSRQLSAPVVNNDCKHAEVLHQIEMEADSQAHPTAEHLGEIDISTSSPSKALRTIEEHHSAFETIDEQVSDSATSRPENDRNTNARPSPSAQHLHIQTATDRSAKHEEADMQSVFDDSNAQNEVSKHSTEGAKQNVLATRQPSESQADYVQIPAAQSPVPQSPTRPPSRASSEAHSRPQSRHSNQSRTTMRPLSHRDLESAESATPRSSHATKVKKSSSSTKQSNSVVQSQSPRPRIPTPFQFLVQVNQDSGNHILETYLQKDALIKLQQEELERLKSSVVSYEAEIKQLKSEAKSSKAELEKLSSSSASSKEEIERLQKKGEYLGQELQKLTDEKEDSACFRKEEESLRKALRKLTEQKSKYAEHMNGVVNAQKWLKDQAEKIRKEITEASQDCASRETAVKKILAEAAEELKNALEKCNGLQDQLTDVKKELLANKEKFKGELKTLEAQIQEAKTQHSTEKQALEAENATLQKNAENAVKNNDLLQRDLHDRLKDLATEEHNSEQLQKNLGDRLKDLEIEKHNNEQLQKNLNEQTAILSEFQELVKQIPTETSKALHSDDGMLAKILSSENTTHEKMQEMTSIIKELVKRESEIPPALVKLTEDAASRVEGEKQVSDGNEAIFGDAVITLLQELKESLSQMRLEKEAEIRLRSQITELEEAKESLTMQKVARDAEVESLATQLEESKRELLGCRSDLNNKNNELVAALGAPREDPALRSKISELEKANNELDKESKEIGQNLLKTKEDLDAARKTRGDKDKQMKDLAQQLAAAHQQLKTFNEAKDKLLALKEAEHKKACQELARNAESQKATVKMRLESENKILDLRVKEKNIEIGSLKAQLKALQAEIENKENADLEAQLLAYKKQTMEQFAHLKRLEQDKPSSQATSSLTSDLKYAQAEIAELRLLIQSAITDADLKAKVATQGQRAVEGNLLQVDGSQMENTVAGSSGRKLLQRPPTFTASFASPQANHEDEMMLVHTPRDALRQATRRVGFNSGLSHFGEQEAAASPAKNGTVGGYKVPAAPNHPKSALKKTGGSDITSNMTPDQAVRSMYGQRTRPTQSNDRPQNLHNIKGLVSGKPARSTGVVEPQSSLTAGQSTPASIFDLQGSPPVVAPKRNKNKRTASTNLESQNLKVARVGSRRGVTRSEIPDSRDTV